MGRAVLSPLSTLSLSQGLPLSDAPLPSASSQMLSLSPVNLTVPALAWLPAPPPSVPSRVSAAVCHCCPPHWPPPETPTRLKLFRDPLDEGCNLCSPKMKLLPLPHSLSSRGSLTCTELCTRSDSLGTPRTCWGLHFCSTGCAASCCSWLSSCCHCDEGMSQSPCRTHMSLCWGQLLPWVHLVPQWLLEDAPSSSAGQGISGKFQECCS